VALRWREPLGLFYPGLIACPVDGVGDCDERRAGGIKGHSAAVRTEIDLDRLDAVELADGPRNTRSTGQAGHAIDRKPDVVAHGYIESRRPKLITTTPKASTLFTTAPLRLFQRPSVPRTRRFEMASRKISSGTMKATL
jgi:hypothetical protein